MFFESDRDTFFHTHPIKKKKNNQFSFIDLIIVHMHIDVKSSTFQAAHEQKTRKTKW